VIGRYFRPNPITQAITKDLVELDGPVFFYGRIGGGKSVSMKSLAEKYHDKARYKLVDLWGGERKEHNFWVFPSKDKAYWDALKIKLRLKTDGPKAYKVHFLYPLFTNFIPKELPQDIPNVKSSFFTIPFHNVTIEDIQLVLGNTGESVLSYLNTIKDGCSKKDTAAEIMYVANKNVSKKALFYTNFLAPLLKNKFLQNVNCSTNINIKKEMRDREYITVLSLDFIPPEFHLFIQSYFLRNLNKLVDEGKIGRRNIILFREAAPIFKATDNAIVPEKMKIFRSQLSNFIRMGRRGVHIFLDAQSPAETRSMVSGQQSLTILCKMPSQEDREAATFQLYRDGLMNRLQVQQLAILEPGQVMWCEVSKKAKRVYLLLPRSMYWEPGMPKFFTMWDKFNGNWINISDKIEEIENDFKARTLALSDKDKEKARMKEEKEKLRKIKDEEEKLEDKEKMLEKEFEMRQKLKERNKKKKMGKIEVEGLEPEIIKVREPLPSLPQQTKSGISFDYEG
jgi:hypothetical protein